MYYIVFAILLIGIDRITKLLAAYYLKDIDSIPLINNVLHLTYAENTGAAFSILEGKRIFFIILTSIMLAGIVYVIKKGMVKNKMEIIGLCIVFAGGFGNWIDRVRIGYVVDFIDFRAINFAIFNFADCCVTVGAIIFGIAYLMQDAKKEGLHEQKVD